MSITLLRFLLVGTGGALGSIARYAVQLAVRTTWPSFSFPLATLIVNVTGSFAIGMTFVWIKRIELLTTAAQAQTLWCLLATGILGGFTTFSAFSFDTLNLLQQANGARAGLALLNVTLNVILGLAAAALPTLFLGSR